MGGSSGAGDSKSVVRYAPYIESHHQQFLDQTKAYVDSMIDSSPFASFINIGIDEAFFGVGYLISSYPSLYDMFGKFMAGFDLEVLWNQLHSDTTYDLTIDDLISAESALLDDEIDTELATMKSNMRDLNAVMTTGFMIVEGNVRDMKIKSIAKERIDLRGKFADLSQKRWETTLSWNKSVVDLYSEIVNLYFLSKMDVENYNYSMATKNLLWPFTVLDYYRAAVGSLSGATSSSTDIKGASPAEKMISGALGGAAMGRMVGSNLNSNVFTSNKNVPEIDSIDKSKTNANIGTAIGAILGLAGGMLK